MKLVLIQLAILVGLAATPCFAESWSGRLVDSKCYDAMERSVSPMDRFNHVERDNDLEISLCTPNLKTKSFALVEDPEVNVKLDPAGNTKAADLIRATGEKHFPKVTVNGQMNGNTLDVNSISIDKRSD